MKTEEKYIVGLLFVESSFIIEQKLGKFYVHMFLLLPSEFCIQVFFECFNLHASSYTVCFSPIIYHHLAGSSSE